MSKYLKFMNTPQGVQQIFTREKIRKMTSDEFVKYEKRIYAQLNKIGIPTNSDLAYENRGKIFIWHTMEDNKVCDECEPMNGEIFERMEDIPDDLHPNCRCYVEEIDLYAA